MATFVNFTKAGLSNLPYETEKGVRKNYYDKKEKNLYLQVGTKTKTFYILKKVKGKTYRVKIGRFPDMAIERARAKCIQFKSQFAENKTPDEIKKSQRKEETFYELFQEYINNPTREYSSYWEEQRRTVERYAQSLFKKKISTITRDDVNEVFLMASNRSKTQANKLLGTIRRVFNKKIIEDNWNGMNPTLGIKKNPEIKRDRFLQSSELPIFFEKLEEVKEEHLKDFVKLALWTGARKMNVLSMKWTNVDFYNKIWIIPKEQSKNDERMVLPLNEKAIEVLKRRKQQSKSKYVFPNLNDLTKHLTSVKHSWASFLETTSIEDLRIHDLRRSFGSYLAISGANLPVIAKALGHKSLKSTEIYARLNVDAVAKASEDGVERMAQCFGGI